MPEQWLTTVVATTVGAVVGYTASRDLPLLLWVVSGEDPWRILSGLLDLLVRLAIVVFVWDIGLTITYRWSNGMTCPMLCLITAEVCYHYGNAACCVGGMVFGDWLPPPVIEAV